MIISPSADDVRRLLRQVQEPSLGEDVVELGLVYEVWIGEGGYVHVNMTSPQPGSAGADHLALQVRDALLAGLPGSRVEVSVVADPRWEPAMMTDAVRRRLALPE
ncbi:MAG: metal-sulfur cluster assembly factor [Gammaproteobacteria bacterium]|nr:metal-sulfur cluster assembly factor [Gammaproteobacteria bacterium]